MRCCTSGTRRQSLAPARRLADAAKQALLLGEPDLFFTAPGYEGWPLVMLRLERVDLARLAELVTDAWRMRAPAEVAGDLEDA